MTDRTLSDEEFERLLEAANTPEEREALIALVKESNRIDQLRTFADWRNRTMEFLPVLTNLGAAIGKLSGNAGLLQTPEIDSLRKRIFELKNELGIPTEPPTPDKDNAAESVPDVALAGDGSMPTTITPSTSFEKFFAANLSNVTHFSASEFLYKGSSHATNHLNTDPPEDLWNNVIPLARLLNKFRVQLGAPVRLISVYRSPAYNTAVGGATASQHMRFKAADLVGTAENPQNWAAMLRSMRSAGDFSGGIGTYGTFVHVDVRGTDVDWTG